MDSPASTPSPELLAQWLSGATDAALEAGARLAELQGHVHARDIDSKSSAADLVSVADREAEDIIRARLAALLPAADFMGEESSRPDLRDSSLYWVVDPLDGTSNFLCGLPLWSVSIALCEPGFRPLLGVVHAPLLNRSWTAARGLGAHCNGAPMRVRSEPPGGGLHNAMLATGFPYDVTTAQRHHNIDYYAQMQRQFQKIRRLGSAAIDLAYVAEGVYDGLWELKLQPWDAAAGLLLVTEAGGLARTIEGGEYTPGDLSMVAAATPQLLARILELLQSTGA